MKERLQELASIVWTLLTDEERMDWACGDGMYNFIETVANLVHIDWLNLSEQDQDDIVNAVYED